MEIVKNVRVEGLKAFHAICYKKVVSQKKLKIVCDIQIENYIEFIIIPGV